MDFKPSHFIGQPIEVQFDDPPLLEKKPGCPDAFIWQERAYRIVELLSEWHDYRRRGRMSQNMRPEHAAVAAARLVGCRSRLFPSPYRQWTDL